MTSISAFMGFANPGREQRVDPAQPPSPPEKDRAALVLAEQLKVIYREIPLISAATLLGGLLIVLGMSNGKPPARFLAWLALLYAAQASSLVLLARYRAASPTPAAARIWARWLLLLATLSGCVWGSAGILMFPDDLAYQALLIVSLFLVAISAFGSTNPYLPAVYGLVVTVLLPIAARTALVADLVHLVLAAGILLLLVLLLLYAHHMNRVIVESINMRFENLELSEALTEQKVQERTKILEAANRHKSEFLASMSHELRTPLNSVIGFSEVMKSMLVGDLNAKQAQYVELIHSSGHHLLSLINDILDLAKVEAGRMELVRGRFDVRLLLESAIALVQERAQRHKIEVCLSVDAKLEAWIGDERKIKQVLLNLLSNAIKFTPDGGRVTVVAALTDGGVEIAVADTGIGIAPQDQARIFEAFHQVGGDYTRKQEGTGLGLSLAKRFVEMHGGHIWVASASGKGSTLSFTLPPKHEQ